MDIYIYLFIYLWYNVSVKNVFFLKLKNICEIKIIIIIIRNLKRGNEWDTESSGEES